MAEDEAVGVDVVDEAHAAAALTMQP
eukprot:COSAG01_NODE_12274_length_1768_cov_818.260036_3_plen_25_part_01